MGSGVRGARAQEWDLGAVGGVAEGARVHAERGAGGGGSAAPGGDQARGAQSARRRAPRARAASRGAARVAQVEARARLGATPGSGSSVRAGAQAPRCPRWAGGAGLRAERGPRRAPRRGGLSAVGPGRAGGAGRGCKP